jgi:hypothetical protein
VTRMGGERKVKRVLVGKPEVKSPLTRHRHRRDQNGSWGDWLRGAWINLAQSRG